MPGLHARDTRRIYKELLGSAERSILAITYAFFEGPKAFEVLARRMDAKADLRVTLLLNIQRNPPFCSTPWRIPCAHGAPPSSAMIVSIRSDSRPVNVSIKLVRWSVMRLHLAQKSSGRSFLGRAGKLA